VEAHRFVKRRGFHIQKIGKQIAVKLSVLSSGRALSAGKFLVLVSLTGRVKHRPIVQHEGLGKLKIFNDLIGIRTHDIPAVA
jgi:hypothetical protein